MTTLPRVERVHVERGDVIVVECPDRLTPAEEATIAETLRRIWPRNAHLVLTNGRRLKLGVRASRRAKKNVT